jgi:hypothetical protein
VHESYEPIVADVIQPLARHVLSDGSKLAAEEGDVDGYPARRRQLVVETGNQLFERMR